MNPFRRKKSHDGGDGAQRSSSEEVPAVPTSSRGMTFRRKKSQPEPKVELDWSTALPSNNDFRTSLLMPNLSARFSMLRDQDDPNTLIGKANDDSVLFPKRISRLNLFNNPGLSDIAEVASLSGSIRPPFAYGRAGSYASTDGYGTDDDTSQGGSVMSRSKPGQGNKFFGGRQKIYKIPVGASASAKDVSSTGHANQTSNRGMGKAVYDDDVAMSAFQALRQREKEDFSPRDDDFGTPYGEQSANDRRVSPTLSNYNRNRETSSSTASGPPNGRISTAATSIASQNASPSQGPTHVSTTAPFHSGSLSKPSQPAKSGPEKAATKGKRMYGQGLDQQMYEQQSSAMNRLDSIQRQRGHAAALLSKVMPHSRSATGLNDRFQRTGPLYASSNFRAGSPPPSADVAGLAGFDLGLSDEVPSKTGRDDEPGFGRSPPLSPPMSPGLDNPTLVASLEPNDLGKATASAAFNKPRTQYNEHQYAQRQLRLQEGRETPPPRAPSRTDAYTERSGRLRTDSITSVQSSLESKKTQLGLSTHDQASGAVPEASGPETTSSPISCYQNGNGTFLAGFSGSESSLNGDSEPERGPSPDLLTLQPTTYQSLSQAAEEASHPTRYSHDELHPAFKANGIHEQLVVITEKTIPKPADQLPSTPTYRISGSALDPDHLLDPVDSPTLGPDSSVGLSGLIRTHLRNQSNKSSIYPDSPRAAADFPSEILQSDVYSSQEDMFKVFPNDREEGSREVPEEVNNTGRVEEESATQMPLSLRARHMLDQAKQLRNGPSKIQQMLGPLKNDKAQQILGVEAPSHSKEGAELPWQEQLREHHHSRGASTETQKEREDFATELADRRRRVQEGLKSYVDSESRAASPMPGGNVDDTSGNRSGGAFGLLKKASRGSLINKNEQPSKAMKMLGLGGPSSNSGGAYSSQSPDEQGSRQENGLPSASGISLPSGPGFNDKVAPAAGPSFKDRTLKDRNIGAERRNRFQDKKLSPSSQRRDVSDSDHSAEPSPNPNGYFVKAHIGPTKNLPTNGYHSQIQPSRQYSPPRPSDHANDPIMQPRSQSAMSTRSRTGSSSRGPPPNIHSARSMYQNNYPTAYGRTPRASPAVPSGSPSSPAFHPTSPSHSAVTTPTMVVGANFTSTTRAAAARKRSVSKHDISEPTFINCTSSVNTFDLPSKGDLRNGMHSPEFSKPPVPPIDPRRNRAPMTQSVFTAFGSRPQSPSSPMQHRLPQGMHRGPDTGRSVPTRTVTEPFEDRSTFSADEHERSPKPRQRLRKTSSEGGNMAARARHMALLDQNSPAMPSTPVTMQGSAEKGFMF
ncbi:hypothetical protein MMC19_004044 [Ptychographa xylographoides]|nr:hypothetical protein [Ptychographa xylographoides]